MTPDSLFFKILKSKILKSLDQLSLSAAVLNDVLAREPYSEAALFELIKIYFLNSNDEVKNAIQKYFRNFMPNIAIIEYYFYVTKNTRLLWNFNGNEEQIHREILYQKFKKVDLTTKLNLISDDNKNFLEMLFYEIEGENNLL